MRLPHELPVRYWKTKVFRKHEAYLRWINRNYRKYQIVTVYVNNGYAVDYKPLLIIDIK